MEFVFLSVILVHEASDLGGWVHGMGLWGFRGAPPGF